MPGVDFRKSSVVARLSTKCFTDPSGDAKRFVGNSGSGACALLVRSGTIANTASSVFFTSRPGSPAGADMTFSLASVRRKSSAAAMCSITCATDQRSAAGLKFHCASDSPFVASRTFFFVVSRYCSALSFSACVTSCADTAAAPAIKSNAISTPTRDLVLIFFSPCHLRPRSGRLSHLRLEKRGFAAYHIICPFVRTAGVVVLGVNRPLADRHGHSGQHRD